MAWLFKEISYIAQKKIVLLLKSFLSIGIRKNFEFTLYNFLNNDMLHLF